MARQEKDVPRSPYVTVSQVGIDSTAMAASSGAVAQAQAQLALMQLSRGECAEAEASLRAAPPAPRSLHTPLMDGHAETIALSCEIRRA